MKRRDRERAPTVRLIRSVPEVEPLLEPPDPLPQLEPVDDLERRLAHVKPILTLVLGTTTGWALRWDKDHLASGVEVFSGDRNAGLGTRLVGFRDWLQELLDLTGAVLVGYENPRSRKDAPLAFVHNLEGVLLTELEGKTSYVCPRAESVGKVAVGRRREASCTELIAAARRRWKKKVTSGQEARALCVLAWVLDAVGEPR